MSLFSGMKLRTRLILAFLMMSLVTATVGSIGYMNMREINSMATEMYQKDLLGLEAAATAKTGRRYHQDTGPSRETYHQRAC